MVTSKIPVPPRSKVRMARIYMFIYRVQHSQKEIVVSIWQMRWKQAKQSSFHCCSTNTIDRKFVKSRNLSKSTFSQQRKITSCSNFFCTVFEIDGYKKDKNTNFIFPSSFFFFLDSGSEIRNGKIRIRDKHPGSEILRISIALHTELVDHK
jgi:hypothetical protein